MLTDACAVPVPVVLLRSSLILVMHARIADLQRACADYRQGGRRHDGQRGCRPRTDRRLHADQIQVFDVAVDNIYATPVLPDDIVSSRYEDLIVVSPDIGGVVRARSLNN